MRKEAGNKKKEVPVWRTKANYVGLLNLPETIKNMGPIRKLTELDKKGEASIKFVKRRMPNGLRENFAYNVLKGCYRDRSFQYLLKDCVKDVEREGGLDCKNDADGKPRKDGDMLYVASKFAGESLGVETDGEDHKSTSAKPRKNYKVLKDTVLSAVERLGGKEILSGVVVDGHFYLVLKKGGCFQIEPKWHKVRVCGADYFSYGKVTPAGTDDSTADLAESIKLSNEWFMLLPLLNKEGEPINRYFYLITSRWREVFRYGTDGYKLDLPRVPGALYTS